MILWSTVKSKATALGIVWDAKTSFGPIEKINGFAARHAEIKCGKASGWRSIEKLTTESVGKITPIKRNVKGIKDFKTKIIITFQVKHKIELSRHQAQLNSIFNT